MKTDRYWIILIGCFVLLLGLLYLIKPVTAQDPHEPKEPTVSEPVAPSTSQEVRHLPTVTPLPPGQPVQEINPRQRGPVTPNSTSNPPPSTKTGPACQH
jgi:hypothetical protein